MKFKVNGENEDEQVEITLELDCDDDVIVKANGHNLLCIQRKGTMYRSTLAGHKLSDLGFETDSQDRIEINE